MAPLVPDIISENLNYIMAFFIGIGFGAILEQAGFSSSKKLVGLFYGYDFTVLRVFLTAGVVAMGGIMGLNHFGLLDMNLVYINPFFWPSAIGGGLVMGLGFVLGGFCPGTSVCSAAIGKIDAFIFIAGSMLGVLAFGEGYPLFEKFYKAGDLGSPQVFTSLGISRHLFAIMLVIMAGVAFFAVEIIENRVNKKKKPHFKFARLHAGLITAVLILSISALLSTDKKETLLKRVQNPAYVNAYKVDIMSIDELSCRLMSGDPRLQIIDFRKSDDFSKLGFPNSYLFALENLFEKDPDKVLNIRHQVNVFVAQDEFSARKFALIAKEMGYRRIRVLEGGFQGFSEQILNFKSIEPLSASDQDLTEFRFRLRASQAIPELMQKDRQFAPMKKTPKRTLAGC